MHRKRVRKMIIGILIFVAVLLLTTLIIFPPSRGKFPQFYDENGNMKYTKKWNSFYERYDIYDSSGNQVGYYKWNSFYERWEFHNF